MSVDRETPEDDLTAAHKALAKARRERALRPKATTSLATRIALLAGSVLVSLAILEAGCRLLRSGPESPIHWPNLARARMSNSQDGSGPTPVTRRRQAD